MNELGILSAHLDHGPCRRVEPAGKAGLGKDLVDEPRTDDRGKLLAAAAGNAGSRDP